MNILKNFFFPITCVVIVSCHSANNKDEGKPLVSIGDKVLYSSVISQLLPEGTSAEDSAVIVKGYIENWIRDHLVISEAEKNIPPDLNLNKLVNDYRSSLLMYNFENQIINKMLDTLVTKEQKNDFYQEFGSQFILSHKIIKAILISSDKKDKSWQTFATKSAKSNQETILNEAIKKGFKINLNGENWIPAEDIRSYISPAKPEKFTKGYTEVISSNNKIFLLKITGLYKENEIPPLEYIEKKIEQVMLNNRKTQLLKTIREDLYKKNLESGTIQYH